MITSFFEGRIRFRSPAFRNNETAQTCRNILLSHKAVFSVTVNEQTASILIEYNRKNPFKKPERLRKELPELNRLAQCYSPENHTAVLRLIDDLKEKLT